MSFVSSEMRLPGVIGRVIDRRYDLRVSRGRLCAWLGTLDVLLAILESQVIRVLTHGGAPVNDRRRPVLGGVGHFPHRQAPEAVLAAIVAFFT